MRIIKHLEECPAQDGSIIYKFRPTVAMKRDIDAKYGSFKSRTDGQRHVDWIVDLHNTYILELCFLCRLQCKLQGS